MCPESCGQEHQSHSLFYECYLKLVNRIPNLVCKNKINLTAAIISIVLCIFWLTELRYFNILLKSNYDECSTESRNGSYDI